MLLARPGILAEAIGIWNIARDTRQAAFLSKL